MGAESSAVDRFDTYQILSFSVPGFDSLTSKQKTLVYYLYAAGLSGRDIVWDQNFRYNLLIRRFCEEIYRRYAGDRSRHPFAAFSVYLKKVWYSNGIHSRYDSRKFAPGFSREEFEELVSTSPEAVWPLDGFESAEACIDLVGRLICDPGLYPRMVSKEDGPDCLKDSAVNFYRGVTRNEAESYYASAAGNRSDAPPAGLNSRLERREEELREYPWKSGGLYGRAIEQIVYWLEKAREVAENGNQAQWIDRLIAFYRSGEPADFDRYNIAWVSETEAAVDAINGFIETYSDPLGYKGTWESLVSIRNDEGTRRIGIIAEAARRFERRMPYREQDKNDAVTSVNGTAIDVVMAGGDSHPWIPRGINLPNAEWIHERHGSKSTNLANIVSAGRDVQRSVRDEFYPDAASKERADLWFDRAEELLIDMHEVVGHGSGRLAPGVAPAKETLKNYANTLEEARADLVGLYFLLDPWLTELGLTETLEIGRAEYDYYMLKGLMLQLRRLPEGSDLEEDHMRAEQLVTRWVLERGTSSRTVEMVERDGKSYVVINDHAELRLLFGELLREVQRIKSEGDFMAARDLVEGYGVSVDRELHREVMERYARLDIPACTGFVNPGLEPVYEEGEIVDVRLIPRTDFPAQMLEYAAEWSFLPTFNEVD